MTSTHTLLLRLSGPLQAWGVESRFGMRDTGREPSKSGVVGLLCAALGRTRDQPIADLARLTLSVRADREGALLRDYHVAGMGGYYKANDSIERRNVIPGNRYYLMDARFLVGLEGDDLALLTALHDALRHPKWPLFLGRRACVPGQPIWLADGLRANEPLEVALRGYHWLGPAHVTQDQRPPRLRLVLEDAAGSLVRPDQPISFAERTFGPRRVSIAYCPCPPTCLEEVPPWSSPD